MAVQIAGSINVDMIQSVAALPGPGETVLAHKSIRLPGGKGANQAVAAARIGAQTHMIAAVGDDEAGRWMTDQLQQAGVGVDHVRTMAELSTGTAYIAVDAQAENQIIVVSGANAALAPEHLPPMDGRPHVLVAQLEVPVETIRAFFSAAGSTDCIRILNAAPAIPEAAMLFDQTDILIVNQHELALYLSLPKAPSSAEDALIARRLISRPEQVIVVTLGAQGAIAVRAQDHFHVPGIPVVPLDSIGAGDCFVGALSAMLDQTPENRCSIEQAISFANAAAALCTQKQGAIPAMPTRAEVEALVEDTMKMREPT